MHYHLPSPPLLTPSPEHPVHTSTNSGVRRRQCGGDRRRDARRGSSGNYRRGGSSCSGSGGPVDGHGGGRGGRRGGGHHLLCLPAGLVLQELMYTDAFFVFFFHAFHFFIFVGSSDGSNAHTQAAAFQWCVGSVGDFETC